MLLFSPLLTRSLLAQSDTSLGLVDVSYQFVAVAEMSDPLKDLLESLTNLQSATAQFVVALEIETQGDPIYAASHDFITYPTDNVPSTPFRGTLDASLVVNRSIIGGNGYGGFTQNVSEFTLINDGLYDVIAEGNSVNGRSITCKLGTIIDGVVLSYNSFVLLSENIGLRWLAKRNELVVEHTDLAAMLDVPAQPLAYLGTGGLEGGEEIKGQRKPLGFNAFNATPVLVVSAEGLFQCNTRQCTITTVKDGGINLNFIADYATVALLRAALLVVGTIPPGSYGTCNVEGYFGIGGVAFKQVTVDFTTDVETTADIIEWLVLNSTELTVGDFDSFTFDSLNILQPAARCYYLDSGSSKTVSDFLSDLMTGIGGSWGLSTIGKLRLSRFDAPDLVPSAYYDLASNVIEIERASLPDGVDPPPRRRRVTYAHNWTQQTDLYGQVSESNPALAAYLADPYKLASTVEGEADVILAAYPFAPDPEPILGYFSDLDDAQDEADRVLELYFSGYDSFVVTIKNAILIHQIGEVIAIRDTTINPRLGLNSNWRYVRIVDAQDKVASMTTALTVFG